MKLYTEEQVIEAMIKCYSGHNSMEDYDYDLEYNILNQLTPIELPSDDEIKQYSIGYSLVHEDVSDKLDNYLVCAILFVLVKYLFFKPHCSIYMDSTYKIII